MITLDQVKQFLRYEDGSNDPALTLILNAAQRYVEHYTGHILTQRTITENVPALGDYYDLRCRPYVADSLAIAVLDSDYAENDDFEAFAVYPVNGMWRVKPTTDWPETTGGYTFSYTAGYSGDAPADLLHAVAVYAAMGDEQRGDMSSQGWKTLEALLQLYRLPTLA